VYEVEVAQLEWSRPAQHVSLDELERVVGLWLDVDAHDLVEPGTVVAHGCTAGTAEQV
jgi:hypothetical protein